MLFHEKFPLFVLVFSSLLHAQSAVRENIAVMELEGNNVAQSDIAGLSNRLRSELFNTNKFRVIERSQMDEILKEQGFQQTGCTNTECAVEAGQLMGVRQIVVGSIDKVGELYSVNLRLVSVESGEITNNATFDCDNCRLANLMKVTIHNAARKLAGLEPDAAIVEKPKVRKPEPVEPPSQKRIKVGVFVHSRGMVFKVFPNQQISEPATNDSVVSFVGIGDGDGFTMLEFGGSFSYFWLPWLSTQSCFASSITEIDQDLELSGVQPGNDAMGYEDAKGYSIQSSLHAHFQASPSTKLSLGAGATYSRLQNRFSVPSLVTDSLGFATHGHLTLDGEVFETMNMFKPDTSSVLSYRSKTLSPFVRAGVEFNLSRELSLSFSYDFNLLPLLPKVDLEIDFTGGIPQTTTKRTITVWRAPYNFVNLRGELSYHFLKR